MLRKTLPQVAQYGPEWVAQYHRNKQPKKGGGYSHRELRAQGGEAATPQPTGGRRGVIAEHPTRPALGRSCRDAPK